jgi:hypothetical protein
VLRNSFRRAVLAKPIIGLLLGRSDLLARHLERQSSQPGFTVPVTLM